MSNIKAINLAKSFVQSSTLDASPSFLDADTDKLAACCNGCGSATAKFDFVPDTIYGMSIKPACQIHDWDYLQGANHADKELADRRFRNNLLRLIDRARGWRRLFKRGMRLRAHAYYLAVDKFGGPAFWDSKNKHE